MVESDPYFHSTIDHDRQIVVAVRPITLTQTGSDQEGVVQVASDRDLVVIGDEVTIRGDIRLRGVDGVDESAATKGRSVQILARRLATIPGASGTASIDVSGGKGRTSTRVWTTPAGIGKTGTKGHSIWKITTDDVGPGKVGLIGDRGQDGDDGRPGAAGGSIDVRCGSVAPSGAVLLRSDGGAGGDGIAGQKGGQGGKGGDGANSDYPGGTNRSGGRTISMGPGHPSAATKGGPGGPGGHGGDGGDGGKGGDAGSVRVRVFNGRAAITTSLKAGSPGAFGARGDGGDPGEGGAGARGERWVNGLFEKDQGKITIYSTDSGDYGSPGTAGDPGAQPPDAAKGSADYPQTFPDSDLTTGLGTSLIAFTTMMLDHIRADYLSLTGTQDADRLDQLSARAEWAAVLLEAYSPSDSRELDLLPAQRDTARAIVTRIGAAQDYFGRALDYAPLGSIEFYRNRFDEAWKAFSDVQKESDRHIATLEAGAAKLTDLDAARKALQNQQRAYDDAVTEERQGLADLVAAVTAKEVEAKAARDALSSDGMKAFHDAVESAIGLKFSDFTECLGQLAFMSHETFQSSAMIISQGAKLADTAFTKVVAADGTQVDKQYVLGRLSSAQVSAEGLQRIVGGDAGVVLSDPGAIKLLGQQAEFDALCDKFWNISGADTAKEAFDDYVSAVQARNAEIFRLNESLARLRAYTSGAAETAASIAASNAAAASASSDAGGPVLVAQLKRMSARASADCIEALYLASRAYSFYSLSRDDRLAQALTDFGAGEAVALTPTALEAAGEQLLTTYSKAIEALLPERPVQFPPKKAPASQRGIIIEFSEESHPAVIASLRSTGRAAITIPAARRRDSGDANPFAGHANVRLTMARCWVDGAGWAAGKGPNLRVDLQHQGRETIVSATDKLVVVRHEPVHVMTKFDSTRPADPDALVEVSDLQDADSQAIGALIGPFARWHITIDRAYNPGVDLGRVSKVTLEFHGSSATFGMPKSA